MEKRFVHTIKDGKCIAVASSMVKKTKDPRERKTKAGFSVFCSAAHLAEKKEAAAARTASKKKKAAPSRKRKTRASADVIESDQEQDSTVEDVDDDIQLKTALDESLRDAKRQELDSPAIPSGAVASPSSPPSAAAAAAASTLSQADMREARLKAIEARLGGKRH
jgi:hypothetical protein